MPLGQVLGRLCCLRLRRECLGGEPERGGNGRKELADSRVCMLANELPINPHLLLASVLFAGAPSACQGHL